MLQKIESVCSRCDDDVINLGLLRGEPVPCSVLRRSLVHARAAVSTHYLIRSFEEKMLKEQIPAIYFIFVYINVYLHLVKQA